MRELLICVLCLCPLLSGEEISVEEWLVLGPMDAPFSAFSEKTTEQAILKESFLDLGALWPKAGQSQSWTLGKAHCWETGNKISPKPDSPSTAYFAGFLQSSRFQSVNLRVSAPFPFDLFLHGEKISGAKKAPYEVNTQVDLSFGKHCLIIKGAILIDEKTDLSLRASIKHKYGVKWTLDSTRTFSNLKDAFEMDSVSNAVLSPKGHLIAIQRSVKKPESVTWIQIWDPKTREIKANIRQGKSTHTPVWAPKGDLMAFRTGSSIYAWRPGDNTLAPILLNEKGLSSFFWAPDGNSLFFLTSSPGDKSQDYTRIFDPRDRLTDWVPSRKVHTIGSDGTCRRTLTGTGDFEITRAAISNSGTRLALVRRDPMKERPFFKTQFWVMDLKDFSLELIRSTTFSFENSPSHLVWSPDDKKIAFTAPPRETPLPGQGEESNAFDSCLWTLDLETKALTRISDRFGESVESRLVWREDNRIYFIANRRALKRLVRIPAQGNQGLEVLNETPTVVTRFSLAKDLAAIVGSSLNTPPQVFLMDLSSKKQILFLDPGKEIMDGRQLGKWERFNFMSQDNDPVDGWIFYPPDFDPEKKYPMVVYYYGGTAPRLERFSVSSYHWLAANGYVLYVVNPAGHVGHTHEFSAKHLNDWGKRAGRDIMEGTKRVLQAKPFIDPDRLGCYGGSYGGFMTLHLAAECDLFKAGCSMYGISNLTSYWGAGIWGYTYGDTAMASNYPWTNPNLFVNQSPIFKAHKINTALLLVHGDADLNVPSNESEQMFTALKVLGKDAAYIRFKGEGHGISSKRSNLLAHRQMMLEWFDKHLKEQPEAWEKRWGKK